MQCVVTLVWHSEIIVLTLVPGSPRIAYSQPILSMVRYQVQSSQNGNKESKMLYIFPESNQALYMFKPCLYFTITRLDQSKPGHYQIADTLN